MLTLADSFRIGSCTVYRDVVFDGGTRSLTSKFYPLADTPRIARGDSGGPAFHFLWYRTLTSDAGVPAVDAGGMVTITVEISPDPADLPALRDGIARAAGLSSSADVTLLSLPVLSGDVTLSFASEEGSGDFAAHVGGSGPVKGFGDERMSFAVELTRDGAALLAKALDTGIDLFRVRYDLAFEYRLDRVSMHVWCDATKAHDIAAARLRAGPIDRASLRSSLVSQKVAGVEIATDATVPPEEIASLQALGDRILGDALASTLFSPPSDGGDDAALGALKPLDESAQASLTQTFTASYPATYHASLDAILHLGLSAEDRAACVATVDAGASFRPLEITVVSRVDFTASLVTAVHVWLRYDATAADGSPIHRATDFAFKEGFTQSSFRLDALPDKRSYSYGATVYYRDGQSAEIPERSSEETLLVLDVGELGVLDVTISLGDVPFDVVARAVVDLRYDPKNLTHQVFLDAANDSATWQVVVGEGDIGSFAYRVTWLTTDGRRIEGAWVTARGGRLFLDAPRGIGATAAIEALSAGDFSTIAQITLELRPLPSLGGETASFSFTAAGQSRTWRPHTVSAAGTAVPKVFRYQARRTIVHADGIVRELDWTEEDAPVLVVRDLLGFEVVVVPRLLDLGPSGRWMLALVTLAYDDEATNLHEQQALVLRDRNIEEKWSFRIGAPDRHPYRYQTTLVSKDGTRRVLPWGEDDQEVLVLQPPESEG